MPGRDELPATLRRSPARAQRIWIEAHDAAVRTYGEGATAHRVAFAAVKHSFHKVGDRWEPKRRRGPSDPRARSGGPDPSGEALGGIDFAGSTRAELYERARRAGIAGRSRMSKLELARALARRDG